MVKPSQALLDRLSTSQEYGEYIMEHCHGERSIGNGDALICAMEEFYLWEEFLASQGIYENEFD
jgi:hypothetical protein